MKRSNGLAWAGMLLLCSSQAHAITTCTVVNVVGVSFGGYDVFDTNPLDSAGSVTYSCSGVGSGEAITLDLSVGNASSYAPRQLRKGLESLDYNLYLDAGRAAVWGNNTGGSSHYGPVTPLEGTNMVVQIYGRIPARQNVSSGSYSDSLILTIFY